MNIIITDLQKADIFSQIFKDIRIFTDNINIMFESERLYIQSMDTAHVMLFEIVLPKEWFATYELTGGAKTIGINSTMLYLILNTREKSQTIEITYSEDDILSIQFQGKVKGEFNKHFTVPLVDIESDTLNIPESDDNLEIKMESVGFAKLIGDLKSFGDTLQMECNEDMVTMSSGTDKLSSFPIESEKFETFSINEGSHLKLSFSLKYLQNICKYSKISKFVELKINDNHPMKIIYALDDAEPSTSTLTFYLAPKINDDEE
jgi:proliferating cell nuclear antigen